jgi:chromatin segregation and condensation protein Rec8/ScpA/Scc1 (kleisin family)
MSNNKFKTLNEAYKNVYVKEGIGQSIGDFVKRTGIINGDPDFYSRERQKAQQQATAHEAEYKAKQAGVENNNRILDITNEYLNDFPLWPKIRQELSQVLNKYRK